MEVYRYWDERPQPVHSDDPDLPSIVFVRHGKEALWVITSYALETRTVRVQIDLASMGLPAASRLVNVETGEAWDITDRATVLDLPSHDVREFRIVPKG